MSSHRRDTSQWTPLSSSYPMNTNRQPPDYGRQRDKVTHSLPHRHISIDAFFQQPPSYLHALYRHFLSSVHHFTRNHPHQQIFRSTMTPNTHQDDRSSQPDDTRSHIDSSTWVSGDTLPYGDGISMFSSPDPSSVRRSIKPERLGFRPANTDCFQPSDSADDDQLPARGIVSQRIVPSSNLGFLQRPVDASQYNNYTTDDLATLRYEFSDDGGSNGNATSPTSSINTTGPFTPSGPNNSDACACPRPPANGVFALTYPNGAGPCSDAANDTNNVRNAIAGESYLRGGLPFHHHTMTTGSSRQDWLFGVAPNSGLGITLAPRNTAAMTDVSHRLTDTSRFRPDPGNSNHSQSFIRPQATVYHQDTSDQGMSDQALSSFSSNSSSTAVADDESDAGHTNDEDDGDVRELARASRHRRDMRLLELRRQGLPYKKIKKIGGFREAESTLRGRVRNLTKDKSERVRRPEWTVDDITLLQRAVELHSVDNVGNLRLGGHKGKMPWRTISIWMREHGASYPFAPATCSRKWDELRHA